MPEISYGVVRQDGRWTIIGDNLRFGSYAQRSSAMRAARRLAERSGGLTVQLHVQKEDGELAPPERVDAEG